MKTTSALIIGSGHLADRVTKVLDSRGCAATHILEYNNEAIRTFSRIFLLDDKDEYNLQTLITLISFKKDIHITTALFNENIAPHIRAVHPHIEILNPAKIAAPSFVDALYTPLEHKLTYEATPQEKMTRNTSDNLIKILIGSFIAVIIAATAYFHIANGLSWIDALYFVVATVTTVGYGDINLLKSSTLSKIIDILLLLSSMFFVWTIFSLTINHLIKRRERLALGRKTYPYINHIILCGLGRLGYFIALELIARNEKIIVIEKNENSAYAEDIRNRGIPVYVGDARMPQVLKDVGVNRSKAFISVINNDYTNLEIGLNARSFKPGLRLVLRIFNKETAQKIKESLDIHLALSMSAVADEIFADTLKK